MEVLVCMWLWVTVDKVKKSTGDRGGKKSGQGEVDSESKEEKPKEGEIRTSMRGEPRVTLVNPTQWSSRPPFGPKVSLHSGDPQPQRIT